MLRVLMGSGNGADDIVNEELGWKTIINFEQVYTPKAKQMIRALMSIGLQLDTTEFLRFIGLQWMMSA